MEILSYQQCFGVPSLDPQREGDDSSLYFVVVVQSRLTLSNPMDCSAPGLPVPHHLLEFAHIHLHCIGDAIQSSLITHWLLNSPGPGRMGRQLSNPRALRPVTLEALEDHPCDIYMNSVEKKPWTQ